MDKITVEKNCLMEVIEMVTNSQIYYILLGFSASFLNETQKEYSENTNVLKFKNFIDKLKSQLGSQKIICKWLETIWYGCKMSSNKHTSLTIKLIAKHLLLDQSILKVEEK